MKIKDWIVINYKMDPVSFQCSRCKETYPMPFNCPIDFVTAIGKAFSNLHKGCKVKKESKSILEECHQIKIDIDFDKNGHKEALLNKTNKITLLKNTNRSFEAGDILEINNISYTFQSTHVYFIDPNGLTLIY